MLDIIDWKIVAALQENGRITYSEIARQVNLTSPAVAERVRKLEDARIITGYHVAVNHERLGYPIVCFVHLAMPPEAENQFIDFVQGRPEVLECFVTTGQNAFILKVVAPSVSALNLLLNEFIAFGQPTTYIVLSEIFSHRTIKR